MTTRTAEGIQLAAIVSVCIAGAVWLASYAEPTEEQRRAQHLAGMTSATPLPSPITPVTALLPRAIMSFRCRSTNYGSPASPIPCGSVPNIATVLLEGDEWSDVDICQQLDPTANGQIPLRCWSRREQPFK